MDCVVVWCGGCGVWIDCDFVVFVGCDCVGMGDRCDGVGGGFD